MTKFYALWYNTYNGEKSACAISKNINSLIPLHYSSIDNPENYYHQYKKNILYINVGEIDCYYYNRENNNLELINNLDEINILDGNFYALNYLPFENEKDYIQKEILVYLSTEDYNIWKEYSHQDTIQYSSNSIHPKFFYTDLISNIVYPDTYYAEGIMNS